MIAYKQCLRIAVDSGKWIVDSYGVGSADEFNHFRRKYIRCQLSIVNSVLAPLNNH